MLTSNIINLENIENINKSQINDTFFSLKKYNITDPDPYIMKEYFQKYVKPIFKIQTENNNLNVHGFNKNIIDKIQNTK